jgi:hypothetical protein
VTALQFLKHDTNLLASAGAADGCVLADGSKDNNLLTNLCQTCEVLGHEKITNIRHQSVPQPPSRPRHSGKVPDERMVSVR